MRKNEKLLRRVLALILCLVMAAMIAACGNTDPNVDLYDPDGTKPTENNTPTQPEDDDSVVIIPGNEGGSGSDDGESCKLAGTGQVGGGDHHRMEHLQSLGNCHGTEAEADGKISNADGHTCFHTGYIFFHFQGGSSSFVGVE